MRYIVEESLENFHFWSGGKDTADVLTHEDFETLENMLDTDYMLDGRDLMTDTQINDYFWFERDNIAQILGFDDWEELEVDHNN